MALEVSFWTWLMWAISTLVAYLFGVFQNDIRDRVLGWAMKSNLVFGAFELIPAEGRPMYEWWWHVTCRNEPRDGLGRFLTARVKDAEAFIQVRELGRRDHVREDRAAFLGPINPWTHTFVPVDKPVLIPVYLQPPLDVPDWFSDDTTFIGAGTYLTGKAFINHRRRASERIAVGQYKVLVRIKCERVLVCSGEFDLEVQI
jgi:hypothetical protein